MASLGNMQDTDKGETEMVVVTEEQHNNAQVTVFEVLKGRLS